MEDHIALFAELAKNQITDNRMQLSFEDQCACYAVLKSKIPPIVVSEAMGISGPTASFLRNAGERGNGRLRAQSRYPRVAAEYRALGHEAFLHRYLTPAIVAKINETLARRKAGIHSKPARDPNSLGVNPRAKRHRGRHEWPRTSIGLHAIFRIEWHDEPKTGWFWHNLKPQYGLPEITFQEAPPQGDPSRGGAGFTTSEEAFRHVRSLLSPEI